MDFGRGDQRSDNQMINAIQGGDWHTNMVILTARYVERGMKDEEIHNHTERLTLNGYSVAWTRSEVQKMIDGARAKGFKRPNVFDDSLSDDAFSA